ncbi:formimidoylglutamase [Caldimonas brevitalea]|uniref:Formimidoylglutamase n=1 Tax=Caldimonas brevitalea TaxID=413882 RepID=A8KCI4_9BURK|nr:formimidoylglutamase [Caldimonas brevitalea]AKJ29085.1 formiminoglutamase [Caldimonas brevitalea]CAL80816.1 formiminoglutamase [Caldimonas brevitalea]
MSDGPWQGRVDALDGEAGRRWHQVVVPWRPGRPGGVVMLGLASDEGVRRNQGRVGAAQGPQALRRAMANLPWHPPLALQDAGDIGCDDGRLEAAQQAYAQRAAALLADGQLVLGLGGGHEIAWASYSGLTAPGSAAAEGKLAIVNFDAHFDLRVAPEATSGTPFRQALDEAAQRGRTVAYRCYGISATANTRALYDTAHTRGVDWAEDHQLNLLTLDAHLNELRDWLDGYDHVYLSLCLDVLPAAVAPGVSAPAARGLAMELLEPLVCSVAGCGRLRLADIAELCPPLDPDGRTARTAARLAWQIVSAWQAATTAATA